MLPQRLRVFVAVLLCGPLAACGPGETPEARVRAVVAAGEEAAEARDLSALMDLVARDFSSEQASGRDELKQYLRGYLVTHPSVHLLTRVEEVELPYRDFARVRLTVGMLGRESAGAGTLDLAADVYEVELELELEDGDWRVRRAGWRPAAR